MKITDLINKEGIMIHGHAKDKMDAIDQMVSLMCKEGKVSDPQAYKEAILERESLSTTGMVDGIAIPHARTSAIKEAGLAAMTLEEGVDYQSMDGKPTDLIFLIGAPDNSDNMHLQVLSELSTLLMDHDFCEDLKKAGTPEEFLSIIDLAQASKEEEETEEIMHAEVLAVTACPTGIAHTYMAAEALEKKAKEMGVSIKVETQGSVGAKNVLTQEDIDNCKGVIIAADKNISLSRFNGLPLYSCPVARGIDEPEKLINIILEGKAPLYSGDQEEKETTIQEKGWHIPYKHLMNGFSHTLPILVAAAFISVLAGKITFNTQFKNMMTVFGNMLYLFVLPVLAGFIAESIADRPALGPGLVTGYIAYSGFTFEWLKNPYTQLSTSGFLGAIVAGFVTGYIVLLIEKLCAYIPDMFDGIKPVLLYPVLGAFVSGAIMTFINTYLVMAHKLIINRIDSLPLISLVIIGACLGAMMSIDMGGPINKFAYLFANAIVFTQIDHGAIIMASVMGAGMIPPLAISFSTLLFKNKWSLEERKTTLKNFIMGLSFVSEGAIPFMQKDQKHVLTACIIGSFITGGLSAYFKCGVLAPHGGIWIIYLMTNPLKYVLALLAGTIVAGLIITFTKSEA